MNLVLNVPDEILAPARLVMTLPPDTAMTADEFFEFCQHNRKLRIERTASGEVIIMAPAGGEAGSRNINLTTVVRLWAKQNGTGVAFDSSTGFDLPNGATRSPDAAWVLRERLTALTPQQKRKFLPLCPDFVAELRSPSDRIDDLKAKLQEYIENGARLGWLLIPETRTVFIYRPGHDVVQLDDPTTLNGDDVLPDFTLELAEIWDPGF